MKKIIVPLITKKQEALHLDKSHPALALFDGFRGQTTAEIELLLQEHHIVSVQILVNCTDKLQPMDISVNKPMKSELKKRFQAWYASEVQKQLKEVPVDKVKVDVTASAIKARSASWIISSWQAIEQRSDITINGFRSAGILDAIDHAVMQE